MIRQAPKRGGGMRRTIYLPDDLFAQVDAFLNKHKDLTFSSLVQRALEHEVGARDLTPLLELAGIVEQAPVDAQDHAEDRVDFSER